MAQQPRAQDEVAPPPPPDDWGTTCPSDLNFRSFRSPEPVTQDRNQVFILYSPFKTSACPEIVGSEPRRGPWRRGSGEPWARLSLCCLTPGTACWGHVLLSRRRPRGALKGGPQALGLTVQPEVQRYHGLFLGWGGSRRKEGARAGRFSMQRKGGLGGSSRWSRGGQRAAGLAYLLCCLSGGVAVPPQMEGPPRTHKPGSSRAAQQGWRCLPHGSPY